MQILLLVESKMLPIPKSITIKKNFGKEIVIQDENNIFEGDSVLLDGSPSEFITWLKPLPGVCVSDNPSTGIWNIKHIK